MKKNITNFFTLVFSYLDCGWCFLITLVSILVLFAIKLIFSYKNGKKLRALNLISLSMILFETFSLLIMGDSVAFSLFNLALFSLTQVPFYLVKDRKIVITKEQKEVVKELELKAKNPLPVKKEENIKRGVLYSFEKALVDSEEEKATEEGLKESPIKSAVIKTSNRTDYSGVKTAIEKTLLKEITEEERRKLISLEISILQAERGEENNLIKSEISEGLSALLKTMARYAV